jgi:hypothetical protein
MKKLVIAIVAVLAIFTFIREYSGSDTNSNSVRQAQIGTASPN